MSSYDENSTEPEYLGPRDDGTRNSVAFNEIQTQFWLHVDRLERAPMGGKTSIITKMESLIQRATPKVAYDKDTADLKKMTDRWTKEYLSDTPETIG